jgi:membrane protein YqaA with SNARE-associated domain
VNEADRAAAEAPVVASRWAIHRRLYDWVLSFAHHRHSTAALAVMSFAESSFFPIPPDVLLMPMCLERRNRAMWYATVCTVASVLGGVAGYFIGYALWAGVQAFFFKFVFSPETFESVQKIYQEYDFWAVFAAGLTPIPYKAFTIAAGVFELSIPMFIVASIVGRGMRFYLLAVLAWKFGRPIVQFVDRYFNVVCIVVLILGVGGFVALKFLRH